MHRKNKQGLARTKGNDPLFLFSSLLELLAEQKEAIDGDTIQYAMNAINKAKSDQRVDQAQAVLRAYPQIASDMVKCV